MARVVAILALAARAEPPPCDRKNSREARIAIQERVLDLADAAGVSFASGCIFHPENDLTLPHEVQPATRAQCDRGRAHTAPPPAGLEEHRAQESRRALVALRRV